MGLMGIGYSKWVYTIYKWVTYTSIVVLLVKYSMKTHVSLTTLCQQFMVAEKYFY